MKKPLWKITAPIVLILFVLLAFVSCGGKAETTNEVTDEAAKGAFKLDVSANIPEAATVEGSGYYDYNENISASVNVKEGYEFLGWYFNETDLLSSQTVYNGKMWNQDVVLKAIVIKCPEGASAGGTNNPSSTYTLKVATINEECGLVSLNDGANETEYTAAFNPGRTFKILAYSKTTKRFLGWYGTSGELITTNASLSLTMPGFNYDLVAVWEGESIQDYILRDFTYSLNASNHYTITGYKGSATSVIIPSSKGVTVTSIGQSAFRNCSALTSITIPNSVTSIGNSAFSGCSALTSIRIPNSVTSIGDNAFSGCSALTSVTIGNGVTSIDSSVFSGCVGLTSVTIGSGVTSIGGSAFSDCTELTSVNVAAGNPVYHSNGNCLIETASKKLILGCKTSIIPTDGSVTGIGNYAFDGCSGLTSVTIPNSVTGIGDSAFYGCSGLTSVTIPDSVTSIGAAAFADCSGLTSVTIGNGVTSIGDSAFYGCSGLTSITIPDSVTGIGEAAFFGCFGLTSVTIPRSVTDIGDYAFYFTGLTTINFTGTKAQWNAISKGSGWYDWYDSFDSNLTIRCTDGNIVY